MAITSYDALKAAVRDSWMLRPGDDTVPTEDFIALAEAEIRRSPLRKHWKAERRKVATVSERYVDVPEGWLEARYLEIQGAQGPVVLTNVTPHQISLQRKKLEATGTPTLFSIVGGYSAGGRIELCPDPSGEMVLEMLFYEDLQLSDASPTNWLLQEAPDVYLYGALVQGARWERDAELEARWQDLFNRAVAQLAQAGESAQHSGGPVEVRRTTSLSG